MPKIIAISGEIGWDVWPEQIRDKIGEAKNNEPLQFDISSPGGYIYDGLEIFNMIRAYEGPTTTRAIGMAASMASYLLMAGDKKEATSNAIFMIHNARAFTGGDQNAHRKLANILEGMSNMLGQEYVAQSGKDKEEIAKLMNEETYLFGNEIIEGGFVDEIIEVESEEAKAKDDFVIDAMLKVEAVIEKLKAKPEDEKKIAACLPKPKGAETPPKRSSAESKTSNEEKHMDPKTMTLDEFLAQNYSAKAVHEQRLKDAEVAAEKKGAENVQAKIDRIHPLISSEGASKALIESGFKALKGESSVDSFVAIADYETRVKEEAKSEAAKEEQPGDTPAGKQEKSNDGIVRNEEDEAAAIAELKET